MLKLVLWFIQAVALSAAAKVCSEIMAYDQLEPVATGRYYLTYYSVEGNFPDIVPCGFFNSDPPCTCIFADATTPDSSGIPDTFKIVSYGLPAGSTKYQIQTLVIDRTVPGKAVYELDFKGALIDLPLYVAATGSDAYESYVVFQSCKASELLLPIRTIIATKEPNPPLSVIEEAVAAIRQNSSESFTLRKVPQPSDCPPPY